MSLDEETTPAAGPAGSGLDLRDVARLMDAAGLHLGAEALDAVRQGISHGADPALPLSPTTAPTLSPTDLLRARSAAELLAPLVNLSPLEAAAALAALKRALDAYLEEAAKRDAEDAKEKARKEQAAREERQKQDRDLHDVRDHSHEVAQELRRHLTPAEARAVLGALSNTVSNIDGRNQLPSDATVDAQADPAVEAMVSRVLDELHDMYSEVLEEERHEEMAAGGQPGHAPGQPVADTHEPTVLAGAGRQPARQSPQGGPRAAQLEGLPIPNADTV